MAEKIDGSNLRRGAVSVRGGWMRKRRSRKLPRRPRASKVSDTKRTLPPNDVRFRGFVEVLERLPFNSRDEGKVILDRVVRNYLIHAADAAGADPDLTVHDALTAAR
jgi:hypothetical protein